MLITAFIIIEVQALMRDFVIFQILQFINKILLYLQCHTLDFFMSIYAVNNMFQFCDICDVLNSVSV